jgi:hypothetical protein
MTVEGNPSSNQRSSDRDTAYRSALAAALCACAEALHADRAAASPDARAMRELQEQMRRFEAAEAAPSDIQFVVFILDIIIADVFRNYFGDLISTKQTDKARRDVCSLVAELFESWSTAIVAGDNARQFAGLKDFAVKTLKLTRELNQSWTDQQLGQGEQGYARHH